MITSNFFLYPNHRKTSVLQYFSMLKRTIAQLSASTKKLLLLEKEMYLQKNLLKVKKTLESTFFFSN